MLKELAEIAFALVGLAVVGRYVFQPTNKELHLMSQRLTDAITSLTTEVSTVLADVAAELTAIAQGTDDSDDAEAIEAQAQRLRDMDATLPTHASAVTAAASAPAADTAGTDSLSGAAGDGSVTQGAGNDPAAV